MATCTNEAFKGMSGRIGNLLFKQSFGQTIVTPLPEPSGKPGTPRQAESRGAFAIASKEVIKALRLNPALKAYYQELAGPYGRACDVAISAWLKGNFEEQPPVSFVRKPKMVPVQVQLPQGLEVCSIQLSVKKADGSTELVTAIQDTATGQWAYMPVAETENNAAVPAVAATAIITKQEAVNAAAAVPTIPAPGIEEVTMPEAVDGVMPETISTLRRKEKAKRLFTGPLPQFHRRITVPSPKDERTNHASATAYLWGNYGARWGTCGVTTGQS